jgi:glycosyltransferase involved in cell wall biosynthesis
MGEFRIHTCFVTFNRLELTKRAIESYLRTVTGEWTAIVVDNASTDGTGDWLREEVGYKPSSVLVEWYILERNFYPGYATNMGWLLADAEVTHLHRADNDFIFLPGWCEEVERMFSENEKLGQLGLRTDEEEMFNSHNVGGNCVIRRELWDAGLRYSEKTWPEISKRVPGYTEDSFLSPRVVRMGWEWDRVERPCIQSISYEDPEDEYYIKSWADRGISRS